MSVSLQAAILSGTAPLRTGYTAALVTQSAWWRSPRVRRRSLGLCILLGVGQAFAGELRWGFSPADGMPYVDIVDHQLQGGFTRQLGSGAQRLGLSLRFVETPNRRIDGFMASGHIHVICNSNPGWDSKPERYHWSPALFEEQDVLLQRDDRPAIRDFAELRGKTLGTSQAMSTRTISCRPSLPGKFAAKIPASRVQMQAFAPGRRGGHAPPAALPDAPASRAGPERQSAGTAELSDALHLWRTTAGPRRKYGPGARRDGQDGSIERLLENSLRAPQEP